MKIVCISDTHNQHRKVLVPDGDVLIHAGDMTMRGSLREIQAFSIWLRNQPHKHKIVVAGNHDFGFELTPYLAKASLLGWSDGNVHYLENEEVVIDGVKFYGSPQQPEFNNWAFGSPRNGMGLKSSWSAVPSDIDVLVTHTPPHKILDLCPDINSKIASWVNVGCEALRLEIDRIKPKLHVFGHIHEGYGQIVEEDTIFVNASICTARYNPTNQPIVVDYCD